MAVKIYKPADSFMIKVENEPNTQKEPNTYHPSAHCSFGFDGTVAWVRYDVTNTYILKEDVTNIQNETDDLTQTVSGVETYFLTFIGG
jgi:hypothetical protein